MSGDTNSPFCAPRRVNSRRERRHAPFKTEYRQLLRYAWEARRVPTPAEARLWQAVRARGIGLRFRRQKVLCGYIADFYVARLRLVIEVDGAYHQTRQDYDRRRDARLRAHGYRVLRFTNEEVMEQLPMVLDQIRSLDPAGIRGCHPKPPG